MPVSRISESDLFGRVFVRSSCTMPIEGYFETLGLLSPLLDAAAFRRHVKGFYLNVAGNCDSVRLSYFTASAGGALRCIDELIGEADLMQFRQEEPRSEQVSKDYGGQELRFRRYLFLYTLIGVDLLRYDVAYARRLAAQYRLVFSPQRVSSKLIFEPAFQKHSATYAKLSKPLQDQLWQDLNYWHSSWEDWAHMMVNMLLPGDWIYSRDPAVARLFRHRRDPIVANDRAKLLESIGLDLPHNWNP